MNINYENFKKNKGISLLELILSLAVIAIILVMATRFYSLVHSEQQLNDATGMIQSIRSAGERWLLSHDDYTYINIDNLIERNLLPKNFGTNPWGGTVTVEPDTTMTKMKITIDKIPVPACLNLENRFSSITGPPLPGSCTKGPGDLTNYIAVFN